MKFFIKIFFLILSPFFCIAQKHDTLSNINILAKKSNILITSPTPVQILNTTESSQKNSLTVADALKHFAGVSIKDFGGIGGLKTISVRSLGANHTGILYDGIALGNAQAGLIDLGKFSLDNIYQIELHNSGPSDLLSTAKAFSYASLLVLKTISGNENKDSTNNVRLNFQYGSFGYIAPSIGIKKQFNKKLKLAFNTQHQQAVSNYPFHSYENNSVRMRRENSDINLFKIEMDAGYKKNEFNNFNVKTYFNNSRRGLPGAVVFYNTISNQRLNEREIFIQGSWKNTISLKSQFLFSAKFEKDNSFYLDLSYLNSVGKLENNFHQKEIYFSAVYGYKVNNTLTFSFATDIFNNKLSRTDKFALNFPSPSRNSLLNNIAFQYKKKQYEFTGNVLHSLINEKVKVGKSANDLDRFSENIAFSIQPFNTVPLRARVFYKHIFRAPTFNDLYYTNVGNLNLRPEFADQYNIGLAYEKDRFLFFKKSWITVDVYKNKVRDKILAAPRQNLFQWSVQNIGRVKIKGIDVALHVQFAEWKSLKLSTDLTYTYQQALDLSDPASPLFNKQLTYTPKHSGSTTLSVEYKKIRLNYNTLFSSSRYKQGDQIYENLLQPFVTNDFSLSYFLNKERTSSKIIFEANNVFNTQYEIIKYYPMPLSNYRITISISLNKIKKPK